MKFPLHIYAAILPAIEKVREIQALAKILGDDPRKNAYHFTGQMVDYGKPLSMDVEESMRNGAEVVLTQAPNGVFYLVLSRGPKYPNDFKHCRLSLSSAFMSTQKMFTAMKLQFEVRENSNGHVNLPDTRIAPYKWLLQVKDSFDGVFATFFFSELGEFVLCQQTGG